MKKIGDVMDNKDKQIQLKEYLLSDFYDKKYKRYSLIDIYVKDYQYYNDLRKSGMIRSDAETFLDKKRDDIQKCMEISVFAFRKLKYEYIVDDYIKEELEKNNSLTMSYNKEKKCDNVVQTGKLSNDKAEIIHCCDDYSRLKYTGKRRVHRKNQSEEFWFPIYKCEKCKRLYTSLSRYEDLHQFKIGETEYINILLDEDISRYEKYMLIPVEIDQEISCRIYEKGKVKKCNICGSNVFKRIIREKNKKDSCRQYTVYLCEKCNIYYIKYSTYVNHTSFWKAVNPEIISLIKEKREKKKEEKAKRKLEKKKQMDEHKKNLRIMQEKERERVQKLMLKYETEKKIIHNNAKAEMNGTITVKDFVVRRSTFKCMHKQHKLENIEALIKIIDKNGKERKEKVSAGYCEECKTFFIMESIFQDLKKKGTPICRVCDEKTYLRNSNYINGMHLAQESVLMQYGYTVSQNEGLSSARRKKILSVLVDNNILTKSDIISYIDFFISQRKYQSKMEKAIEKWESDREFVAKYKAGTYAEYGVKGIYRKY